MLLCENLLKLNDYRADRHITTGEQVMQVKETLKLDECGNDDLQNYRDMCVMLWSRRYEETRKKENEDNLDFDESEEIWNAMMSITAVIDDVKWRRGMEV